jgi:hypothetical protein
MFGFIRAMTPSKLHWCIDVYLAHAAEQNISLRALFRMVTTKELRVPVHLGE